MAVKIEHGTKIGDNNAIGDNASVKINENNATGENSSLNIMNTKEEKKNWFVKHPWLSAIICSLIASILLLLNWGKIYTFAKALFSK